jgi:hypothetical protein
VCFNYEFFNLSESREDFYKTMKNGKLVRIKIEKDHFICIKFIRAEVVLGEEHEE